MNFACESTLATWALPRRLKAHAVVVLVGWPLLTLVTATLEVLRIPYYPVSLAHAAEGALSGVLLLLPEILLTAIALLALTWATFNRFGIPEAQAPLRILAREPVLMFAAIICGVSLWYPGVLSETLFRPLSFLPAAGVTLILAAACALRIRALIPERRRLRLAVVLAAVGLLLPITNRGWSLPRVEAHSPEIVVLGLDSISQADPISPLSDWVKANGGTWYTQAVAPGLITNATWTSILTMRPVGDHGVFHTFQRFPVGSSGLLEAAKNRGYRTVSFFSDQLTSAVGSEAGFDVDRSGPIGWRQLFVPIVANASILIPLVKPLLPRFSWMSAPPNLAGTFTYNVRREVNQILTSGSPDRSTFVAAHLTYLHLPVYPSYADLSWVDKMRVATAPAWKLRDRSFDWQDIDYADDPVKLRSWKLAHLQQILVSVVERTAFLRSGGKLLVISDHGHRAGLTIDNFNDEQFHRVVLATLGLESGQSDRPVSLTEVGALLGFAEQSRAEPVVEFTLAPPELWLPLMQTARLHWTGQVELDEQVLGRIRDTLRQYRPSYEGDSVSD